MNAYGLFVDKVNQTNGGVNRRSFHQIDPSKPGNRLIENPNGTVGIIAKTPTEVFGEKILRPVIDRTISFLGKTMTFIKDSGAYLDQTLTKMVQIFPRASAEETSTTSAIDAKFSNLQKEDIVHLSDRLSLEETKQFFRLLRNNTKIKTLYVRGFFHRINDLHDKSDVEAMKVLIESLKENDTLKNLILDFSDLTEESLINLFGILHCLNLESLSFYCHITRRFPSASIMNALDNQLFKQVKIRALTINFPGFSNEHLEKLAQVLKNNHCIQSLRIPSVPNDGFYYDGRKFTNYESFDAEGLANFFKILGEPDSKSGLKHLYLESTAFRADRINENITTTLLNGIKQAPCFTTLENRYDYENPELSEAIESATSGKIEDCFQNYFCKAYIANPRLSNTGCNDDSKALRPLMADDNLENGDSNLTFNGANI